ncbi:hypothetical protein [Allonocardiopsis opalescens]|uniref:Uncharacterized protein n=1 Tax=Allonocardiopsis opalescens TaxID=1144618 RepID=A0A2T0Q437_9ACTN|nr:hypothetical protein [Allonocardiopsis opalescens]PRX98565.1 hypothetical protein CLV72_104143 [Allonocardiopsis opalescens]
MNVHHLDLRGAGTEAALAAVDRAVGPGSGLTDSRRALVLDDTSLLPGRQRVYERILTSGRVDRVVCVAVGGPQRLAAGRGLLRPQLLNPTRGSTILWVDDPTGIGWAADPPGAAVPYPGVEPGSGAGLALLVDLLGQPEVFDEVSRLGEELPEGVACPGLRWAAASPGYDELTAALARAAAALTRPSGGPRPGSDAAPGGAAGALPREPALAAGRRRAFQDAAADAGSALAAAGTWRGLFGPDTPAVIATELLPAAGTALAAYRDAAADECARLEALPAAERAARLRALDPGVRADDDPRGTAAALRERVDRELAAGMTLPDIGAGLNGLANRVAPSTGAVYASRLRGEIPPGMVDALLRPEPPPRPAPVSAALVLAFASAAVAALPGPPGLLSGGLVAVLWVLAMGLVLTRLGSGPSAAPLLLGHGGAVALGVAAGAGLGAAAGWQAPEPLVIGFALAAGLGLAAGGLLGYWRSLLRRWTAGAALRTAEAAAEAVGGRLLPAAWSEWASAGARRRTADGARMLAGAVGAAGGALSRFAEELPAARPGAGEAGRLDPVVRFDLARLVGRALRPAWDLLDGGAAGDVHAPIRERTAGLLAEYERHVRDRGLQEPPGFVDPDEPRPALPESAWRLDDTLASLWEPPEGLMLQLCDPASLNLLTTSREGMRAVGFAPRATRSAMRAARGAAGRGRPAAPGETVWTESGRFAGRLRLVPLRAGTVESVWETADDTAPPPESAAEPGPAAVPAAAEPGPDRAGPPPSAVEPARGAEAEPAITPAEEDYPR